MPSHISVADSVPMFSTARLLGLSQATKVWKLIEVQMLVPSSSPQLARTFTVMSAS